MHELDDSIGQENRWRVDLPRSRVSRIAKDLDRNDNWIACARIPRGCTTLLSGADRLVPSVCSEHPRLSCEVDTASVGSTQTRAIEAPVSSEEGPTQRGFMTRLKAQHNRKLTCLRRHSWRDSRRSDCHLTSYELLFHRTRDPKTTPFACDRRFQDPLRRLAIRSSLDTRLHSRRRLA